MGIGGSKDEVQGPDPSSPEMMYMTKMYEEIVVLPGSIHKLLTGESAYSRCLFLLARHVLQPALTPEHRSQLSAPVEKLFEVLLRLTHEHLRLANAFSAFSILEYLEYCDADEANGHRLGDLLLMLVPSVSIYEDYLHCFKHFKQQPNQITPQTDQWLCGFLKQRFAHPSDLIQLLVLPLQRLNELVNRLREVLLVLPSTYADFDSLRRSFTQHVLLQNMENCEVLKQVAISGFLCIQCGSHVSFERKKKTSIWDSCGSADSVVHCSELLVRSNCNTLLWRSVWAVLMTGGHLVFFKEEDEVGSEQPMAVVALHRASLDPIILPNQQHCLKLCCPERVYYIAFSSDSCLQEWKHLFALEPSDALFDSDISHEHIESPKPYSEQESDPDNSDEETHTPSSSSAGVTRTLGFTPNSSYSSVEIDEACWPELLRPACSNEPIMLHEPCTLWSGLPPAALRGTIFLSRCRVCFFGDVGDGEDTPTIAAISLKNITSLRRTNSGIVNCNSFRISTTDGDEVCFAELAAGSEDVFYAVEMLWHATLQRLWHATNLLASKDGGASIQQSVIQSLQKLNNVSPRELQSHQLTEHARHWFQLPDDETLLRRFGCSLIHKIVFTGHLYITSNFVCFCSAQYGERVAVVIPLEAVEAEAYDSMMLMPCAIRITTSIGDYLFGDFSDRNVALEAIIEAADNRRASGCFEDAATEDWPLSFVDEDSSIHTNSSATFMTNEADTDTAYTCMESDGTDGSRRSTVHEEDPTEASDASCEDEESIRSLHASEESMMDTPPGSPAEPQSLSSTYDYREPRELLDECGFLVPQQHVKLLPEVCSSIRLQQRMAWTKHLKLNGTSIELVRTKSLMQLTRHRGVPMEIRGMVWASCCGALNWKHTHRGHYQSLLQQEPTEAVLEQIRKDLTRSLSTHKDFREEGTGVAKLERVLCAYACHNRALGYCQAMNFLCAFLLVFMDEENAFWSLCCIVEQLLPDYFTYDVLGSLIDCAVFEELVAELCPKIAEYLDGLPLYPVSRWFMGLFLHVMPYATVARIWDCFLSEGPTALFRVGLALFRLNESALIDNSDPNDFLHQVQQMAETCYDSTEILRVAFDDELSLSTTRIRDLRARHRVRLLQERQQPVLRELVGKSNLSQEGLVELVCGFVDNGVKNVAAGAAEGVETEVVMALRRDQFHSIISQALGVVDEAAVSELFDRMLGDGPDAANVEGACADGAHVMLTWNQFMQGIYCMHSLPLQLVSSEMGQNTNIVTRQNTDTNTDTSARLFGQSTDRCC